MDGTYDSVFHQSGSSTPMTPNTPSNASGQYKANVNRQKTRKWVEAKTVDYGGDDWGNEYGDDPEEPQSEPQPHSHSKPLGPRLPGTPPVTANINQQPPSPAGPRPLQTSGFTPRGASPALSASPGPRAPAGAPPLHIQTQQHQPSAQRPSPLETGSPWVQGPPSRGSTPGVDSSRAVSPPTIQGHVQGQRSRGMSPAPPSAGTVPTRFPHRKSSLGQHDAPPDSIFSPPFAEGARLSTGSRPGSSHTNTSGMMAPSKPWVESTAGVARPASPAGSAKSPTTGGKALPLIRPADIYKRLGEERERERRSVDSGRPSMDSITGPGRRGSDTAGSLRAQSPAGRSQSAHVPVQPATQTQVRPEPEMALDQAQVEPTARRRTSFGRDDDDSAPLNLARNPRPSLATVAERKSEYNIEGLIASYEARGSPVEATPQADSYLLAAMAASPIAPAGSTEKLRLKAPEPNSASWTGEADERTALDRTEGMTRDGPTSSGHGDDVAGKTEGRAGHLKGADNEKAGLSGEELRRLSISPKLPELGRLSAFGLDLFSSSSMSPSSIDPSSSKDLPPVPAIPSSHFGSAPPVASPPSAAAETPVSVPALPQNGRVVEAAQGQAPGKWGATLGVSSRDHPPASGDGTSATRDTKSRTGSYTGSDADSDTDSNAASTPDGHPSANVSQRSDAGAENLSVLQSGTSTTTSKSEPQHEPSGHKAVPATVSPSEVSMVTPVTQASQRDNSEPTSTTAFAPGTREAMKSGPRGSSPSRSNTPSSHTSHPQANPSAFDTGDTGTVAQTGGTSQVQHATAQDSPPAPTPISKIAPEKGQCIAPTEDHHNHPVSSSAGAPVHTSSTSTPGMAETDEHGGPATPKEPLTEAGTVGDVSEDTIVPASEQALAPPARPNPLSPEQSFLTARSTPPLSPDHDASAKESEKLSDEILRSLSPATNGGLATQNTSARSRLSVAPSGAARESSFLPDLYDDYWSFAGSGNAPEQNATEASDEQPVTTPGALKVAAVEPRSKSPEAAKEDDGQSSPPSSVESVESAESVQSAVKTEAQPADLEVHRPVLPTRFSWEEDSKVDVPVEPKSLADQQQVSTALDSPAAGGAHEHPNFDAPLEDAATRLADDKDEHEDEDEAENTTIVKDRSPSPRLPSEPKLTPFEAGLSDPAAAATSSDPPNPHPGPLTSHPVLTFREIMDVPSQTERIEQFNKARQHYASTETGLDNIIQQLAPQHPDVIQASRVPGSASQLYSHQIPSHSQEAGGLLSSTPGAGSPAGMHRHYGHTAAAVKDVGPKTKELFAAAGKASKGFFSTLKAKSKKDAHELPSPPPRRHPTTAAARSRSSFDFSWIKAKRNSWNASSTNIQDSIASSTSRSNNRRTSFSVSVPAAGPAPGSNGANHLQQNETTPTRGAGNPEPQMGQSAASQRECGTKAGSARRGRFSLSELITLSMSPQEPQKPLLAGTGVRQQQQQQQQLEKKSRRNPSQLNAAGPLRLTVSTSSSPQPPQLPPPTRVSPFSLHSPPSPFSPPSPHLPPLPDNYNRQLVASADNDLGEPGQLVSPLSDTFPSPSRPTPVPKDQDYEHHRSLVPSLDIADRLRIPAPISKYQPTWDPYTATPLFEEEGFDLNEDSSHLLESTGNRDNPKDNRDGPSADASDRGLPTLTGEGSDDIDTGRAVLAPGTTKTSDQTQSLGQIHEEQAQTVAMAAYAQHQQHQQLPQQQYNHPNYPPSQSPANNYHGQLNHAPQPNSNPGWQTQTPSQAWQQSQLYEYHRQQQGHPQGQQPMHMSPQQQYQQAQHLQQGQPMQQPQSQQQPGDTSPHRQSSFVGLPPIRRTSTLMSSVVKAGADGDSDTTSIASHQQPPQGQPGANNQPMPYPQFANQNQMQAQPVMQSPPSQQFIPGAYRPTQQSPVQQNQQAYTNNAAYQGMQQQQQQGMPGMPLAQLNFQQALPGQPEPRGFAGQGHPQGTPVMNGDPRTMPQGQQGQSPGPQFVPQRLHHSTVSPNAGDQIRLPPQGAWKLEESHLQQPLLSPGRNRSPSGASQQQQQPYYGFDKETGLPAPAPAPAAQQQQGTAQPSQAGQQPIFGQQGQQTQIPQPGQPLARTDTTETGNLVPPGPLPAADEKQARRSSGLFSNIRGRFSRESGDDRRESTPAGAEGGKFPTLGQQQSQQGHATSDAISESSVATGELEERRKRHSLFGLPASSPSSQPQPSQQPRSEGGPVNGPTANVPVGDREGATPQGTPVPFDQRMQQAPNPNQIPPLETRRTFFGGGGNPNPGPGSQQGPLRPDMSRASTSNNVQGEPAPLAPNGGLGGPPKKRFSGLTSMFHRSGNHQDQGSRPIGSSHSMKPSFSQAPQGFQGPNGPNMPQGTPQQGQGYARPAGIPGPMFATGGPVPQQVQQQRQQGMMQGQPGQQMPQQGQQMLQQRQPGQPGQPGLQGQPQGLPQGQQPSPLSQVTQQGQVQGQQQSPQSQVGQPQRQVQVLQQSPQSQPGQQGSELRPTQMPGSQPGDRASPPVQQYPFPQQQQQEQGSRPDERQGQQGPPPQQQQQQQQQQQRGLMGPPPPVGRGRSDSNGSRPFTPGDGRPNPMMMQSNAPSGDERGRKPSSGGGFLSSIFGGRSGSKPREPKQAPGQGQPPQGMMMRHPGQMSPGQQQGQPQFGQLPGQLPGQYPPGQERIPSPLSQQQPSPRPTGPAGQFGAGQHGMGRPQFLPQGGPGSGHQFAQTQAPMPGQQRPGLPSQHIAHNMVSPSGPMTQQVQGQVGGPWPVMHQQQLSQQSQTSASSVNVAQSPQPGQQQLGQINWRSMSPVGQPSQQEEGQQEWDGAQRTSPGPLNQHPLQSHPRSQGSPALTQIPAQQEATRQETASPPSSSAANNAAVPAGSPRLGSPVSQISQPTQFSPVERQQTDSPLSFRQPAPSHSHQHQHQASHSEVARQGLQASTPTPPGQSPARKPVQASQKPQDATPTYAVPGGSIDQSRSSPSVSAAQSVQSSPVDHSRRPSVQQQLRPQQASSPLAQQPQPANNQQQPLQRVSLPGSSPAPLLGPNQQTRLQFPGAQPGSQLVQAVDGPQGQFPPTQQASRPFGQQPGQAGTPPPGQPYAAPPGGWMESRSSTAMTGPGLQQGQQQPYFQNPNSGPVKEHQSTMSKLFKGKLSSHPGPNQEKPEKDKAGKGLFGFRRTSKQPGHQQPLQGGPQFQHGPPGGPVKPSDASSDRFRQLQAQVPGEEPRVGGHSPTPSPGPFSQYQHQRQSPPNGVPAESKQTPPGQRPSTDAQQSLSPAQGPPQQEQQNAATLPQQGGPPPGQLRPGQGPPPGQAGRPQGAGLLMKPANQRQGTFSQKPSEPQYGDVPIPGGYGRVHGEGRVEPAPVAYYMGPGGQFLPVQTGNPGSQQQSQPWVQPGVGARQISSGSLAPQHMVQSTGQIGQSPAPQRPGNTPPAGIALGSGPPVQGGPVNVGQQQPRPKPTPGPPTPGPEARGLIQTSDGQTPQASRSHPNASTPMSVPQTIMSVSPPENDSQSGSPAQTRGPIMVTRQPNGSSPPPQVQHPASPQSYPLPDAAFSPINSAAMNVPNPPLPDSDLVPAPLRKAAGNNNMMAVPQRQVSAVSQMSSLHPGPTPAPVSPPAQQVTGNSGRGAYLQASSPNTSLSPQMTPDRNISPEPPSQSPPPGMYISVQRANQHDVEGDNIYDATPRTATIPVQQSAQDNTSHVVSPPDEPAEPKAAGPSHEVLEQHQDQQVAVDRTPPQHLVIDTRTSPTPSPPVVQHSQPIRQVMVASEPTIPGPSTNGDTNTTPPAKPMTNPVDIFEEAKRKAVLRDMEEKIPVFPTEPDMNAHAMAEMEAKKKAEEERPQMSATSYPGQEWNPYGEGYEEWE